jgi:hypothetical protein
VTVAFPVIFVTAPSNEVVQTASWRIKVCALCVWAVGVSQSCHAQQRGGGHWQSPLYSRHLPLYSQRGGAGRCSNLPGLSH